MRTVFAVTPVAAALLAVPVAAVLLAVPAAADNPGSADPAPDARPGTSWMERLDAARRDALEALRALQSETEQLIDALPRYKMPYVDENGNIIIERSDGTPTPRPDLNRPDPNWKDDAAPADDMITL